MAGKESQLDLVPWSSLVGEGMEGRECRLQWAME